MYAVGVGKAVEDELREIASDPVEKHFYYTADFSAISTIAETLKLNVCPGRSDPHNPNLNREHFNITVTLTIHVGHAHSNDLIITGAPTGQSVSQINETLIESSLIIMEL